MEHGTSCCFFQFVFGEFGGAGIDGLLVLRLLIIKIIHKR